MKHLLYALLLLIIAVSALAQPFKTDEIEQWKKQAGRVTIMRDNWGIAHIYGPSDADAVFGMLYAQCEDDFARVEMNYIIATARLAEVEGEDKIYSDLRTRLLYDTLEAIQNYQQSAPWLKKLCEAFAGGINYYLYTHPEVKPLLLTRFKPWMPFLFSEGSIGGDIERISVNRLKEFYTNSRVVTPEEIDHDFVPEPRGSNGFALAPTRSATGNALLLINPHTSFYFRPEIHVVSNEGLGAYGAVTWGQFFIYQGFNQHCGWMHTTSQADAVDFYKETIINRNDSLFYKYNNQDRAITKKKVVIAYKEGSKKKYKAFEVFYTHHGPVVERSGDQWLTIRMMKEPVKALMQSYLRTKAKDLKSYEDVMLLNANTSNNTVFADAKGNIAYWHGNYIPKRDTHYDWSQPVDGSIIATEWKGLHDVKEIVRQINPSNGWIQNCNSTPFTVSGKQSPVKESFPAYMAPDTENARGLHAIRLLDNNQKFTLESLITAAYDSYLPGFETLIPSLAAAYDVTSKNDTVIKTTLAAPVGLLKQWDLRYGVNSVATTLAIYWVQHLRNEITISPGTTPGQLEIIDMMVKQTTDEQKVQAMQKTISQLNQDFGKWNIGWGEVNRFQRLTGKINETYDDNKPSYAVPFTSSNWGSLAAFGSRSFNGTKKMYGYFGNSFVAVVEFGQRVKAKSVLAGGVSNNPTSPYFNNQAERYSQGNFKDVYFYKDDVVKHTVKTYQPGK